MYQDVDMRRGLAVPQLRAWRIHRALTQLELARRARVSHGTISSGENGGRIQPVKLARLARALGVERRDLIDGALPLLPAPQHAGERGAQLDDDS